MSAITSASNKYFSVDDFWGTTKVLTIISTVSCIANKLFYNAFISQHLPLLCSGISTIFLLGSGPVMIQLYQKTTLNEKEQKALEVGPNVMIGLATYATLNIAARSLCGLQGLSLLCFTIGSSAIATAAIAPHANKPISDAFKYISARVTNLN